MRKAVTAGVLAAALMAAVAPVATVTNGEPDGNRHPFVGVAIQPIPSMPGFISVCSGSALSPTVFLTAAHVSIRRGRRSCRTSPGRRSAWPWTLRQAPSITIPSGASDVARGPAGADTHDVAVITLAAPNAAGPFVLLPSVGLVDTLPMNTSISVVGYGVQGFIRGGGQPGQVFLFTRYFAPSQLIQSNNVQSVEFIKLTANPAQGKGGICFGDSGGPDLLDGTHTVLAVNTYVTNSNCTGVTYSNRVDLPDILDFINGFLQ